MAKRTLYMVALLTLTCLIYSCENYQAQLEEEQKKAQLLKEQLGTLEEEQKLINGEYAEPWRP